MSVSSAIASNLAPVESIRREFPALERKQGGWDVAYFDGPGGTQVPSAVGDAMLDYLYRHNANTHWAYPSSRETDEALDEARETYSAFLNCSAHEVIFGANMTSLTLHLSRALGLGWGPGDEVIVTELDHHANIDPWRVLQRERGVTVHTARMDPETGQLDMQHLESLFTERTRLLAFGAASNAIGTITDVQAAARLTRNAGALLFVDGVHLSQHELPDVQEIGCDFFGCSAYKFYGPHVGVLYAAEHQLEALPFASLEPAGDVGPERAESGTLNHEGIVGASAAVRWLAGLASGPDDLRTRLQGAFTGLHERSRTLTTTLWEALSSIDGVTCFGPGPSLPRTPTIGFTVRGHTSGDVCAELGVRGLFLSHGDFYALTVIRRLGLEPNGLVRAGIACYTTADEIQRLVDAVADLAAS